MFHVSREIHTRQCCCTGFSTFSVVIVTRLVGVIRRCRQLWDAVAERRPWLWDGRFGDNCVSALPEPVSDQPVLPLYTNRTTARKSPAGLRRLRPELSAWQSERSIQVCLGIAVHLTAQCWVSNPRRLRVNISFNLYKIFFSFNLVLKKVLTTVLDIIFRHSALALFVHAAFFDMATLLSVKLQSFPLLT